MKFLQKIIIGGILLSGTMALAMEKPLPAAPRGSAMALDLNAKLLEASERGNAGDVEHLLGRLGSAADTCSALERAANHPDVVKVIAKNCCHCKARAFTEETPRPRAAAILGFAELVGSRAIGTQGPRAQAPAAPMTGRDVLGTAQQEAAQEQPAGEEWWRSLPDIPAGAVRMSRTAQAGEPPYEASATTARMLTERQ